MIGLGGALSLGIKGETSQYELRNGKSQQTDLDEWLRHRSTWRYTKNLDLLLILIYI